MPGQGKSVHVLLNFSFDCYIGTCSTNFKKYIFLKGNYTAAEIEMCTEDWCQSLQGLNLMESRDQLTDKFARLIEKNIPESKISTAPAKRKPYVNQQCLNSIRAKYWKWTKYRRSVTNRNYDVYKAAKNTVKSDLRKAKYSFEKYLASKIKSDNRLFWSYVRSKMKTRSSLEELE